MIELIRAHQLNLMLVLCGACFILVFLLLITRFLSKSRKLVLIGMELIAFFLLWFDRLAYVYAGDLSHKAYIMVRVSNFMVFFLTSGIVFTFNLYLKELIINREKNKPLPKRIMLIALLSLLGMILAVISAFTDLYYYFDESNTYHRGSGFLIAYIIPVVCPIMQYTVIRQYRKVFSKLIYISLNLYIFVPIACGILQIFTYGISIVNMSMVAVSVALYIFTYLDINNTVEHAHEIEIKNMLGEQERMRILFGQTAEAFVSAIEKRDDFEKGKAKKIAEYSKKLAIHAGKSDEECEKAYFAGLLHDVGLLGLPDSIINKETEYEDDDIKIIKKKPVIGGDILSCITEFPYLYRGALYAYERWDGKGYPEGLKGDEIPEVARLIAVAAAYVNMTTNSRNKEARQKFEAREFFVKEAGEIFDPYYADIMVKLLDSEYGEGESEEEKLEKEIECREYRVNVSKGIPIENSVIKVSFDCDMPLEAGYGFSAPSIVLFDSYDGRTHYNEKAIKSYKYNEYGEIWFDKYSITTGARKIEEKKIEDKEKKDRKKGIPHFEIIAGRYEDHLRLTMIGKDYAKEVVVALPNNSASAFIGLTGENCRLTNISVELTGESIALGDIPRIVDTVNYIDHLEADLPNVQIDRPRSAYTEGVEVKNKLKIEFNTMSLPGACLVWHCPYIVVYSSDDGTIGGQNYREYTMIKVNGENDIHDEYATNKFIMKKKPEFPGWEEWKKINKEGVECQVTFEKKGSQFILKTENQGIYIENITNFKEMPEKIYVALSGDQVALTDIRVS